MANHRRIKGSRRPALVQHRRRLDLRGEVFHRFRLAGARLIGVRSGGDCALLVLLAPLLVRLALAQAR
jgi:hypothetical protein